MFLIVMWITSNAATNPPMMGLMIDKRRPRVRRWWLLRHGGQHTVRSDEQAAV